jgi:hypothetical protein
LRSGLWSLKSACYADRATLELAMAKSANKTQFTDVDVTAFIDAVAEERQRADARKIVELMERLTNRKPKMYGPSIIGFGVCRYKLASGREGEMPRLAFSPRKGQTVLYITDDYPGYAALMAQLGKHKTGKACLYVKRLSDIDTSVLEQLCVESLIRMEQNYPE